MSVTFFIAGETDHSDTGRYLNLSNTNARGFLQWLGLPSVELFGSMDSHDLAALCRRRCWPEIRDRGDTGRPTVVERGSRGATVIHCGVPPGYFDQRAQALLKLTDLAGQLEIVWG